MGSRKPDIREAARGGLSVSRSAVTRFGSLQVQKLFRICGVSLKSVLSSSKRQLLRIRVENLRQAIRKFPRRGRKACRTRAQFEPQGADSRAADASLRRSSCEC